MKPLLSPTALASIRRVGEAQMTTEVQIFRPEVIGVTSPQYDANYDYGDDWIYEAEPYEGQQVATAYAWFFSTLQSENSTDEGQLGTIDLHVVRLPVGTDVKVQDIIKRVDTGEEYVVVDTNAGDTWSEKLKVNVRRRE